MDLEGLVARILRTGIFLSMVTIAAGIVAMLASGVAPLDGGPTLAEADLVGDLAAGRPAGVLWAGLLVLLATPSLRVLSALLGFLRSRQRGMTLVSLATLTVLAASVVLALGVEP